MSHITNEVYLESAKEGFDHCVELGNYEVAKEIIEDVFEKGFTKESLVLEQILLNTPLAKFAITTPYAK